MGDSKYVTRHTLLQVSKTLKQEDFKIQTLFKDLNSHFGSSPKNVSIEDILTVPGCNTDVIDLLKALARLGRSAEADLRQIEKCKEDNDIYHPVMCGQEHYYGLSGVRLDASESEQSRYYVPEDLFGYKKEALPKDTSGEKFIALLDECQSLLGDVKNLDQGDSSQPKLDRLQKAQAAMMVQLRRHMGLISTGLAPLLTCEPEIHMQLNVLFKDTLDLLSHRDCYQKEQIAKHMECAWLWENGPPSCVLSGSSLENLSVRLYGLDSIDLDKAKMFITMDGNFEHMEIDQKEVWLSKKESSNQGVVLHTSKISLKNLKGERKRGCEPKLYRVGLSLIVSLLGSEVKFQCMSLPFAVRTGSPQLWPYTAHVVWFVWTQEDLCEPDTACPREIPLASVISLIQARMSGAGLRLFQSMADSAKRLPDKQSGSNKCSIMLPTLSRRLTDGERLGWEQIFKQRCGPRTRELGMVGREHFTKTSKQANVNDFTPWALVCGAVNTGLRLKKLDIEKFLYIGLTNDICKHLGSVSHGEFIFRCSMTRLNNSSAKEPHVSVVFEVCSGTQMRPMVTSVERLETFPLKEVVGNISLEQPGNKDVRWILPYRLNVQNISEPERERGVKVFLGKEYTNIVQKEFVPETVVREEKKETAKQPTEGGLLRSIQSSFLRPVGNYIADLVRKKTAEDENQQSSVGDSKGGNSHKDSPTDQIAPVESQNASLSLTPTSKNGIACHKPQASIPQQKTNGKVFIGPQTYQQVLVGPCEEKENNETICGDFSTIYRRQGELEVPGASFHSMPTNGFPCASNKSREDNHDSELSFLIYESVDEILNSMSHSNTSNLAMNDCQITSNTEPGIGDSQNPGMGDSQSSRMGDSQSSRMGDSQTSGIGDSESSSMGDSQSSTMGDFQTPGMGNSQFSSVGDSQSSTMGDSRSSTMGDSHSYYTSSSNNFDKPTLGEATANTKMDISSVQHTHMPLLTDSCNNSLQEKYSSASSHVLNNSFDQERSFDNSCSINTQNLPLVVQDESSALVNTNNSPPLTLSSTNNTSPLSVLEGSSTPSFCSLTGNSLPLSPHLGLPESSVDSLSQFDDLPNVEVMSPSDVAFIDDVMLNWETLMGDDPLIPDHFYNL